jgi:GDP-mannose 6-dehydrogenase
VRIAVFGLGYVGCVSAACLADLGHSIIGVDTDEHKVGAVNAGESPFHEPGLTNLLGRLVHSGLLRATASTEEALATAEVALLCVGTPSDESGNIDLQYLRRVCQQIAATLPTRGAPLTVAIRSTIFPGVGELLYNEVFRCDPAVRLVANPEFLREGVAIADFFAPSLVVVGGDDESAVAQVASIYAGLPCPVQKVSLRAAEMIKYACNAFHATKIAFANEIGSVSRSLGIPAQEVMRVLCEDAKLNISPAYLKPGFAFGGSCLPKDLRALQFRAAQAGLSVPLLDNVLASNRSHLERLARRVLELPAQRLGIVGLAFKEDTDDLRESPALKLVELLLADGRNLRIHDPHIGLGSIYGQNQRYLLSNLPHSGRLLAPSLESLISWADHLVLTQKPAPALREAIASSGLPVLDLSA